MRPEFSKVDFEEVIAGMVENHALDNYPKPLGKAPESELFHNPEFPGQRAYKSGPSLFENTGGGLSQENIYASRQAARDAIRYYMPEEAMMRWMHEFFSSDFLHSESFIQLLKDVELRPAWRAKLNDTLSLNFAHPKRVRDDSELYTETEFKITYQVCREVPAIPLTVIAYQAAFVEYLKRLEHAVETTDQLSPIQKERAIEVMNDVLAQDTTGLSFVSFLLPAVAIHYYAHHDGKFDKPPIEKDFTDAMEFAAAKGAFVHTRSLAGSGTARHFACPAGNMVSRLSSINMDIPEGADKTIQQKGIALYHIFRSVDKAIRQDGFSISEAIGKINEMVDQASAIDMLHGR